MSGISVGHLDKDTVTICYLLWYSSFYKVFTVAGVNNITGYYVLLLLLLLVFFYNFYGFWVFTVASYCVAAQFTVVFMVAEIFSRY